MNQPLTAKDYLTRDVSTTTAQTDIHQAISLLVKERISGMPVLDGNGKLVGILTTRDCLKIAFSASYHKDSGGPVSNFMTADVETVNAEMDIVEVAELFVNSRYHQLPVTSEGRLLGMINRYDVLKALAELW
jgi:CBS domain-containing protein